MQAPQTQKKPPAGVIFDTSLDEIDHVLALAMLFGLEGRRQVRVPAVSTSRFNLRVARLLDLVARFYGGEQAGDVVVNRNPLPIGMMATGTQATSVPPMLDAVLSKAGADGKSVYPRTLASLTDTADPVALIRNGLSAQIDGNAIVILAGLPANLLAVAVNPDARAWVTRKARVLAIAGGRFDGGGFDAAIRADVAGFRRLL